MNFQDLLNKNNVPYQTEGRHVRSGWIQFQCPFCGGGSDAAKPYMGYNVRGNYCNCWNCGHHHLTFVLQKLTKLLPPEVHKIVDELKSVSNAYRQTDLGVITGELRPPYGMKEMGSVHRDYLESRGFNPDEIFKLWSVMGISFSSKCSWSLYIPIIKWGHVVSWTTRYIGESEKALRYIAADPTEESLPRRQLLYGEDYCRHTVVICEGPLDVWAIGPGAVCIFGDEPSPGQILALAKYPVRAICFDNEPAAQKLARNLMRILAPFDGETYNIVLDSKDPASSKQEAKQIRELFLTV